MHVTRLSITPIKGLELHHPDAIEITESGAVGDRLFYLVDDRDTLVSVAKTGGLFGVRADYDDHSGRLSISAHGSLLAEGQVVPGAVHTANFFSYRDVRGHLADGPWNEVFSERVGRRLRLVKADAPNGGVDVEPLTLLGDASTAELARTAGLESVDARRFRMLIEFDGAGPHAEDAWRGRTLQVGDSVIEIGGPVQRCAGTTRNAATGAVDLRTLALIGDYRGRQDSIFGMGFNFGVYARAIRPGRVAVGDELVLAASV